MRVQALIAEAAVERLDERVIGRLAGICSSVNRDFFMLPLLWISARDRLEIPVYRGVKIREQINLA